MKARFLQILWAAALLCSGIIHAQTTTQTIFDYGSSWKYLDNGTNQGTAWSATGFSDASWASGTGYFGYGDSWITTCVNACGTVSCNPSCGSKYITTYFRKTINISDTALFDSVRLSAYRDDGIVVYVNGVEVWRDNMPASPAVIAYNTLANSPAIGGADETTPVSKSIPIAAFVSGNNVIAVELHQQATNSSDLTFNMQALGVIRTKIFGFGAQWKYLANGVDQGTAWRSPSFNDASWTPATGHIGFGESWTTTCIPAGPTCSPLPSCNIGNGCAKYTTSYLRKTITLPNISVYDSIKFSMFRDDGIVMYVNGTEVWRDNMPIGTISYSTLAPNNITGTTGVYAESLAVVKAIPISAFANESNTIAVELHQNSSTSSDLDFNVQMTGVLHAPVAPPSPVTLSQGPYLQMGNKTAVSVRWRTNIASKSRVQVGTVAGTYPIVVNDAAAVTEHELRVTGLQQNTKYYYTIGTDTSIIQGDTSNFFVTAPSDTSTRHITIAAFGDCGRNDNSFQTGSLASYQAYLASQNRKAADLMLLVGDNAYDAGTDAEFSANFFSRYSSNILKNHILFPAPGNHDYANNATRQADHNIPYFSLFTVPTAAECGGIASGTEAYYSYDWGNVHILSLDSYGEENGGTTRLYDTLGAQVNWIKNDLAANNKKWTIVYFHHPPYTMGSHTSDGESELVNIRQNFIRILERYGVDMVICGHSHDYERSYLLKGHYGNEASFNKAAHTTDSSSARYNGTANSCPYTIPTGKVNHGTVYVVSGSAGADGGVQSGYPHNALPFSIDDGGMFYIDIQDNRLDAKFLRRDNTIADQFTMMKDVKVKDTVAVLAGGSVNLTASWPGAYAWAPGATSRTVTVTPANDTTIVVKDSLTHTCLTDTHFVNVQCTMPAFTTCPANIEQSGCNTVVNYSVADTGRFTPVLSYAFSGATTASGNGTGSGATFNTGITNVTITATNACGSATCNFNVTIDPLPAVYTVTGGGNFCTGNTGLSVGLSNSQAGVNYQLYDGTTAVGSPVSGTGSAISFGTFTATAAYSVVATEVATGCTSNMSGAATVTEHPLPEVYNVTGGGAYCEGGSGSSISISNSQLGVSYQLYNGATAAGSAVAGTGNAVSFGNFTNAATYSVVATYVATGCKSDMSDYAIVSINPLPLVFALTGGGNYCNGAGGVPVGIANSESGVNYRLYTGAIPVGSAISGSGSAISFGNITGAATYTAVATNATTGCISNMTGTAIVAIDPLPLAYPLTGGGNYCSGGTGQAIGLANSQPGVNYQLYTGASASGTPVTGTGEAISFGLRTIAGTYTVMAVDPATSCTNNMSGAASIGINPLPPVYSVTGGGDYCVGGTGVHLGLGGSGTGISYQVYNAASPSGMAVAGSGSPLDLGLFTAAGAYSVVATNVLTGCTSNMPGSATVVVNPVLTPSVTLSATGGFNMCQGMPNTFIASVVNGGSAPVYKWKVNGAVVGSSNIYAYTPANGDMVSITVTGNALCATTPTVTASAVMVVSANVMPAVSISADPGNIVCQGVTVTLNAAVANGGTAPSFSWIKNSAVVGSGSSYSYIPAEGDDFIVSLTSNQPCRLATTVFSNNISMGVRENYIPVVAISALPGTTVKPGEKVTFTAAVTDAGVNPTYQWRVNNSAIPGATAATFVAGNLANNDSVSCIVTATDMCGYSGRNTVIMHIQSLSVGADEVGRTNITIMPNPNNGDFTIDGTIGSLIDGEVKLTVTDLLGQVVYTNLVTAHAGHIRTALLLGNNIAPGTYLLTVNSLSGSKVFHFVVSR